MTDPKPYRATPDELCAIDDALAQKAIPSPEELPVYYRRVAAQYRARAESASTAVERHGWRELAEQFDKAAEEIAAERGFGFV